MRGTENGPGAVDAARGPDTGGEAPVTTASYGVTTRQQVFSGKRRVPGLYERTLADGTTVFEANLRLNGRMTRRRLDASTKTDAVREVEALRVDSYRGEEFRSPS